MDRSCFCCFPSSGTCLLTIMHRCLSGGHSYTDMERNWSRPHWHMTWQRSSSAAGAPPPTLTPLLLSRSWRSSTRHALPANATVLVCLDPCTLLRLKLCSHALLVCMVVEAVLCLHAFHLMQHSCLPAPSPVEKLPLRPCPYAVLKCMLACTSNKHAHATRPRQDLFCTSPPSSTAEVVSKCGR